MQYSLILPINGVFATALKNDISAVHSYQLRVKPKVKQVGFCGSSIEFRPAAVTAYFNDPTNLFEGFPLYFTMIFWNTEQQSKKEISVKPGFRYGIPLTNQTLNVLPNKNMIYISWLLFFDPPKRLPTLLKNFHLFDKNTPAVPFWNIYEFLILAISHILKHL